MRPIRKLLLRELLVLIGPLVLVFLGVTWAGTARILDNQLEARSRESLETMVREVRTQLAEAEQAARTVEAWWQRGRLSLAQPGEAVHLVRPFMEGSPNLAEILLVTPDGMGLSVRRISDGRVRSSRFVAEGSGTRYTPLPDPQAPNPNQTSFRIDYRMDQRPWFQQAARSELPGWAPTYAFGSAPEHGISHATPLRDMDGTLRGVVCVDLLLAPLSRRLERVRPTPGALFLVSDAQRRVLLFPQDLPQPGMEQPTEFLGPVGRENQPLFARLLDQWKQNGWPSGRMALDLGDRSYWGRVIPLEGVRGLEWTVAIAVPQADHLGASQRSFLIMGLVGLLALGLALWRGVVLARRLSAPLEALSGMASSLGQGAPCQPPTTRVLELHTLGEALCRASDALREETELRAELQHAQRLETVGTLAGGIAHDVNNQLAAILGQLNLGRETLPEDHPAQRRLLKAEEAADRCAQMVKSLMGFSHRSQPELAPLDLNDVVRHTASLLERVLGGRIRLDLELDPQLPAILGERVSLEQVLMNLAVNARDAMADGGTLTIETGRIAPDAAGEEKAPGLAPGDYARIVFRDTGCGMDADTLSHVFEPFFTTKDKEKGTGLGLATSYGIIQQHGGSIQVESELNRGTTFRIYLPINAEAAAVQAQPVQMREATGFSKTILLVEDDVSLRKLAIVILQRGGYDVIESESVDDAVRKASEYRSPIHLVLTDVVMPKMKGPEVFSKITAYHPETKVL
ncbi:MAG TPA: ATP-binding protein, partial [Holophaga sp.]|nr:ATP-binding protein [Holophaga sp.]